MTMQIDFSIGEFGALFLDGVIIAWLPWGVPVGQSEAEKLKAHWNGSAVWLNSKDREPLSSRDVAMLLSAKTLE